LVVVFFFVSHPRHTAKLHARIITTVTTIEILIIEHKAVTGQS
jgi:hypothetical protein